MRLLPNMYEGASKRDYAPTRGGEVVMDRNENYFKYITNNETWVQVEENEYGDWVLAKTIKAPEVVFDKEAAAPGNGMRFNSGKVRFGLIPGHWTRVLAQILTKGAAKYAPRNWEKGLVHSEVVDSLHRHLDAFLQGERYDPELKTHHLGHVAWNALALMTMDLKGLGTADLPTDDNVKTMED